MTKLSIARQSNATLMPVKFAAQDDAVLAVVLRTYSLSDATQWDVSIDTDGECLVSTHQETMSAPINVGQFISLAAYDNSPRNIDKTMKILVCLTSSSNYKKKRAIIVRDGGNGVWEESQRKLSGVVPPDVFAETCKKALAEGEISQKPGKIKVDGLDSLLLNVSVGIVKCPFRLDHALALVKRIGTPRDVYGEKLLGAVPFYTDDKTHKPKWKLVYDIKPDGSVAEHDVASIDHIAPKSKGGVDRLVNMQLMRKIENTRKGNDEFAALADPSTTMEVLQLLASSVLKASAGDNPKLNPEFAYEIMMLIRKEMKAAESTAKKFARRYEQATINISKQIDKTDKEKTNLKKMANAEKKRRRKAEEEKNKLAAAEAKGAEKSSIQTAEETANKKESPNKNNTPQVSTRGRKYRTTSSIDTRTTHAPEKKATQPRQRSRHENTGATECSDTTGTSAQPLNQSPKKFKKSQVNGDDKTSRTTIKANKQSPSTRKGKSEKPAKKRTSPSQSKKKTKKHKKEN